MAKPYKRRSEESKLLASTKSLKRLHPSWTAEQIIFYQIKKKEIKFCECGCGNLCKNRFVPGHNRKGTKNSEEQNFAIFKSRKGTIQSEKTKLLISNSQKERYAERGDEILKNIIKNSGKRRFPYVSIDGIIIKMRSTWETKYAQYLDSMNLVWQYEPKHFKLSNGRRYFPDFYLPALNEYHEVKGWMSGIAQLKIDLFRKEYPNEKLVLIFKVPNI